MEGGIGDSSGSSSRQKSAVLDGGGCERRSSNVPEPEERADLRMRSRENAINFSGN